MKKRISAEEALSILLQLPLTKKTENIPLDRGLGRILAGNISSSAPIPAFDKSPFDGYAFRSQDTSNASHVHPALLKVMEVIPAGFLPQYDILPGTAARIMTGAPIPKGADAVMKYEDTTFDDHQVAIYAPQQSGQNIIYTGEEFPEGACLIKDGTYITPAVLGILASQGFSQCTVYKKPRVTLINIGSELVSPGTPLTPGKIYNTNRYTISGYLQQIGLECIRTAVSADDPNEISQHLNLALTDSDVILTTGGASVGDYDYTLSAFEQTDAELLFWKVRLKPGSCMLAAQKCGRLMIGLSGNPGAAILALYKIVTPYLRKLTGRSSYLPEEIQAILKYDMKKSSPNPRLLRGKLVIENGTAYFYENPGRGNGMISSFFDFDLVGEIPAGTPPVAAGTVIKAFRYLDR